MLCDACKHPLLPPDALPTPAQTDTLRSFLSSGALPLDTSEYQSQIATSEAGLARYDAEIRRLHETLRGLLADRSKLQDYTDGLRAGLSPIRSLPPETLGEIFAPFSQSHESRSVQEELEGLAKVELLELSKVCSRWHRVILGTPHLWSDITVNLVSWPEDPSEHIPFLQSLSRALQRGAQHPLTLSLKDGVRRTLEHAASALTLLAQYSQRWQHISFQGRPSLLNHVSHIKGSLGIVETLSVEFYGAEAIVETFEIAPKLTQVSCSFLRITRPCCLKLPWNQLRSFTCIYAEPKDISYITALMRNLSNPEATVDLRCFDPFEVQRDFPAVTSTISSTISSFLLELWPSEDPGLGRIFAGRIFACLTLPHLRKLIVIRKGRFKGRIPWPANHFESLSLRSSFCDTLRVLYIPAMTISDDELLSSLASLGSLERLVISDQLKFESVPEHVLITDAILLRLTYTPDSRLIPNLTHLTCTSLFKFSANVYLDFVLSRIRRRAPGEEPFQCGLRHFRRTAYEFDPGVHQKLLELVERRELEFSIGEEGKGFQ
ncbi:hypothetical protein C8R43DRAFT_525698 [Mycena crocata]|nr:hypothetical protein C8R43DRAFT_525698 [Mycena crocata]